MSFGSTASYRSSKPKISNLIFNPIALITSFNQNIFRLDIPVYKIFFMNTFQPLNNFDDNS